jgi:hypothetical protein
LQAQPMFQGLASRKGIPPGFTARGVMNASALYETTPKYAATKNRFSTEQELREPRQNQWNHWRRQAVTRIDAPNRGTATPYHTRLLPAPRRNARVKSAARTKNSPLGSGRVRTKRRPSAASIAGCAEARSMSSPSSSFPGSSGPRASVIKRCLYPIARPRSTRSP